MSCGMELVSTHRGADHTPRTILIAQAFRARQKVLRVHNMPQEAIPTSEMMNEIANSIRRQFEAEHRRCLAQRPNERFRERNRRVRSAFRAYVIQALTAGSSLFKAFDRQTFWKSIRTNNISDVDRDNVQRYEDEQRHRNAVITSKIIKLGLCIAKAWARKYASTRSRPE